MICYFESWRHLQVYSKYLPRIYKPAVLSNKMLETYKVQTMFLNNTTVCDRDTVTPTKYRAKNFLLSGWNFKGVLTMEKKFRIEIF
jgi:hypothetical protein